MRAFLAFCAIVGTVMASAPVRAVDGDRDRAAQGERDVRRDVGDTGTDDGGGIRHLFRAITRIRLHPAHDSFDATRFVEPPRSNTTH